MAEPKEDNWAHRSKGMLCVTCMWWVQKKAVEPTGPPNLGRCRRRSPTMAGFPVTFSDDWCGDHKLDEEKV